MLFITGFFLISSLQASGIFGVELRYVPTSSMSTNIKTNPTEMLKRAEKAESHGDYDTSIGIYRQLTPIFEKTFGPQHPNTLHVLNRLYLVYNTAKKYSQALSPAWQLYKINKKLHGEEDERTIEFLTELGKIYYNLNKYEKAEQLLKRAHRLNKSKLGQNHKTTIVNLFILAHVYRESPDPEKLDLALRYYQKVYDVTSKAPAPETPMGQDHEMAIDALRLVGDILSRQEKFKESAQVFQKVLALSSRTLGEDHPITEDARKSLVHALSGDGKIGQANEILRKDHPGKEDDEESFYTLFDAKSNALEKEGKYSKAIEILAEFYDLEMLKPQVPAHIFAILYKLIRYSRQQGDFEEILKWANAAIDLVDLQNEKVKVTTVEDRRDMILIRLNAIDSFIYVYAAQNDEEQVDEWFEIASSIRFVKGQGQGQKGQESIDQAVFDKFLSIAIEVAEFKEKIGKTEEALTMYLKIAGTPNGGAESLTALAALIDIAIKNEDNIRLTDVAQKFLQRSQSEPEKTEGAEETEEMVKLRESVTSKLANKAKEEFDLKNHESAFSLLKIVEFIWAKKFDGNFSATSSFLGGIAMAAFKSRKVTQGFFYLEKAINLYKEKLANDNEMDDEERERIVEKLENLVQMKEKSIKRFSKELNFEEGVQTEEKIEL